LAKSLAAGIAVTGILELPVKQIKAESSSNAEPLRWKQVHPGIWRGTVGTPESNTPVGTRLVPPALENLASLPSITVAPLNSLSGMATTRGCLLRLPLEPDEMIYGFGLQFLSFEQRGKKKAIRVNADPTGDTGDSHAPVPFYVTSKGYGILVDTFRHADFYCGDARSKPTHAVASAGGVVNAPQDKKNLAMSDPGQVSIEVPRAAGVDVYLFAGPTILNAVQRYNLFSGGGPVPPEWGLGFWYRMEAHAAQERVLSLAEEFRERKMPCDVIGLEPGWQTHSYSCTFVWDPARFHDPKEFLSRAAALGYKVNLWEHAFTHPASPLFGKLLPHSGNYGVWGGLVPDFAGLPAREIFGGYHGRELIDAGISGFKLDECDNSDYTGGWSFPDVSRFPSGLDGEQMHGVFGLRYQHALWQQFLERQQPTYNLVRSSGALATPYPFVLYSDLYDHRQFIRALVNSSFSGLLWCPEVRDARSEEDFIRRLQSVVFSPLAMINAWYVKNPPWKQLNSKLNNEGYLAKDWQVLEARCREIIGWRMQLVPYLHSAFERYAADGTPPFRALVLDYADDKSIRSVDDEYMVGDRMFVAPLFAGEESREITLPPGTWHDFWTGSVIHGNTKISVSATTKNIPAFVKAGSVFPLATIGLSSASPASGDLTVRVYGDGSLPWRRNSPSGAQMELSWDWTRSEGRIRQRGSVTKAYRVVKWEHMG